MEKAIHGLFPLEQHPNTPRVFGVAYRRSLRRQTLSTVCEGPLATRSGSVARWRQRKAGRVGQTSQATICRRITVCCLNHLVTGEVDLGILLV